MRGQGASEGKTFSVRFLSVAAEAAQSRQGEGHAPPLFSVAVMKSQRSSGSDMLGRTVVWIFVST